MPESSFCRSTKADVHTVYLVTMLIKNPEVHSPDVLAPVICIFPVSIATSSIDLLSLK